MTEEEKNAIELIGCLNLNESYIITSKQWNEQDVHKAIDIILNLIEKLQKENKELRSTKNNCPQFNTSGVSCKLKQGHYISKDKIKGKIKEYNKEIKTYEDKMLEITQREKHQAIENKDFIKYSCIISNFTDKIKLLEELLEEK